MILVCVTELSDSVAVHDTSNVARFLREHDSYLPVAACEAASDTITNLLSVSRLPTTITVNRAAEVFGRAGIAPAAQLAVMRHIHRMGEDAVALMQRWHRANYLGMTG